MGRRVIKPVAEEIGAPSRGFYSVRHTAASLLFRGANAVQVQRFVGHHSTHTRWSDTSICSRAIKPRLSSFETEIKPSDNSRSPSRVARSDNSSTFEINAQNSMKLIYRDKVANEPKCSQTDGHGFETCCPLSEGTW